MNLKELIEKAVTLPLTIEMERVSEILWEPTIYQRNAHPDQQWVADLPTWPSEAPPPLAALLVHAANLLPELVEALKWVIQDCEDHQYARLAIEPGSKDESPNMKAARVILEKATTINIEQKGK